MLLFNFMKYYVIKGSSRIFLRAPQDQEHNWISFKRFFGLILDKCKQEKYARESRAHEI